MERGEKALKIVKTNYHRPIVLIVFLVLLTFLAYFRSIHAPLIFDDVIYIRPLKLKGILTHFSLHVRSVAVLSLGLNYYLSGMNLVAFRFVNIIFHVLSALLASYLSFITLTLPSIRGTYEKVEEGKAPLYSALLVGTLFLLHPIQTSAVNYITQRMAIMACMFSLAGFICYIKGVTNAGKQSLFYYILSAFSFVLAIFSKENAVMAVIMLPVFDFFFLSSFQWREFKKRFITLSVIIISLASITAYGMNVAGFVEKVVLILSNPNQSVERYSWMGMDIHWTPIEYLFTELRVISRYVFLIFVPVPSFMVFDYSNAYPLSKDLFHPLTTLLALLFLLSLLAFSLKSIKKTPIVSFGILWYLITISLESFVAIGLDPYFEYRNYLPSFGLFLAVASLLMYVHKPGVLTKKIILLVALLLSVLTFMRNGVWREGRLLWADTVEKVPDNVRARINLGTTYASSGLFDNAIEQYQIVLKKKPDEPGAHLNMGVAFFEKGLTDKAIEEYQNALKSMRQLRSPPKLDSLQERTKTDIYFNLGTAFQKKGLMDQAIEQYQIALKLRPDFAEAHVNLGIVYGALGLIDKAMEHFQAAVELDPDLASAHYNLGVALARKGMTEAAIEQYRIALKLNPAYAEAHLNLGIAYMVLSSIDKAVEHFQAAIRLRPEYADAYARLEEALSMKGRTDDSIEQLQRALQLNPKSAEVHKKLGDAFFMKGQTDKAIEEYEVALRLKPGDAITLNSLGIAYLKKGLPDKAIEQYQSAVQSSPGSVESRLLLGDAFFNKGLLDKAIEQYQSAVELQPNNAVAHFNLGVAYTRKGLIGKAGTQLEAAARISPDDQRFQKGLKAFNEYRTAVERKEGGHQQKSPLLNKN